MNEAQYKAADSKLNSNGRIVIDEAVRSGIDPALGCAIVEQESQGRNIFGCDAGDVGDTPPYCGQPVTADRVFRLRDGGAYSYGMNGVGLTQLTYYTFIEEAEALGGAHIPVNQCKVGFKLLAGLLDKYNYNQALGSYNAGEAAWWNGSTYADSVASKHAAWTNRFEEVAIDGGTVTDEYPTTFLVPDKDQWLVSKQGGSFARASGVTKVGMNSQGWLYADELIVKPPDTKPPDTKPSEPKKPTKPSDPPISTWKWPPANAQPTAGSYAQLYPTRYDWRPDVEKIARNLVDMFEGQVWCNTYYNHPPDWGFNVASTEGGKTWYIMNTSVDCWDYAGRGYAVDPGVGAEVFNAIFNDPNPPNINWCIWQGWIWVNGIGWKVFVDDGTGLHYDHFHITYI